MTLTNKIAQIISFFNSFSIDSFFYFICCNFIIKAWYSIIKTVLASFLSSTLNMFLIAGLFSEATTSRNFEKQLLKRSNFQGNKWRSSFLFIVKTWTLRKDIATKILLFKTSVQKYAWYFNKSISWGDTSDLFATFENIFVCWDKLLEDTTRIISQNLGNFQGKCLWWSSVLAKALPCRHRT